MSSKPPSSQWLHGWAAGSGVMVALVTPSLSGLLAFHCFHSVFSLSFALLNPKASKTLSTEHCPEKLSAPPGQVLRRHFLPLAQVWEVTSYSVAPEMSITAASGQDPQTNPSLSPSSCCLRVFGHCGAAAEVGSRPHAPGPGGLLAGGGDRL